MSRVASPRRYSSPSHGAHDTKADAAKVVARSEATRRGAVSEPIEVRATAKDATVGPGVRPLAVIRQPIDAAGAHAEPAAVRDRIRPRHTFDRMRGPLGLAAPTGRSHV